MTSTDDKPEPRRRSTPRIVAISALLILVIVAAFLLITRGNDDSASTAGGSSSNSSGTGGSTGPSAGASSGTASSPSAPSSSSKSKKPQSPGSASGSPVLSTGTPLRAPLRKAVRPAPSLVVNVTRVEKVQAKAEIPGEVSGPALRITIQVRNTSQKTVPIKTALTNLYYGADRRPATQMTKPGSKAFPEKVPAGGTGTGIVLYTVPQDQRGKVVLEVIIDAQMRRIEFQGDCTGQC